MIVDASVVLKWGVGEVDSETAERLFLRSDLAAPAVLHAELGYTLTKLARQQHLTRAETIEAWRQLRQADVAIYDDDALLDPAFELSLVLNASFYDCVYLALAVNTNDVLVTADERFIRAVRASPAFADRVLTLAEATAT